ncbi:radical SAM family heme chaperone HemW [Anaeromicropila herbilytica]|nr:radical SAM family heme chaperone HemW [Anaeromicropila herbilytica]
MVEHDRTKKDLGIYIHIPFCERKCNYCDFLSAPADDTVKEKYVSALRNEIRSYQGLANQYNVRTIYIGGGTPSSIHEDYITSILSDLYHIFEIKKKEELEITIEANPGTLTKHKLLSYKDAGINRLSIGLQSANNEELKLLGRIHTFEEFVANYNLARKVGFDNINIDVISSLPNQTEQAYLDSLMKVVALNPEHISSYSLIIEEGTLFEKFYGEGSEHSKELPSEDVDRTIYEDTKTVLKEYGYERYEISNYAKVGFESKHNSSYWTRTEYLGIGLGASSLIGDARYHNENNLNQYIDCVSNQESLRREEEKLSGNNQMEEFMFLGLRMCRGISKKRFCEVFEKDIQEVYGSILTKLLDEKLIMEQEDYICLTERGLDLSNYVFSEFLLDEESE